MKKVTLNTILICICTFVLVFGIYIQENYRIEMCKSCYKGPGWGEAQRKNMLTVFQSV